MSGIFISYRREDSAPWAGRLHERLSRDFDKDQLFIDVDNIAPGVDFVRALDSQVAACGVFLCVIGKGWLGIRDENGERRIDDPNDFVRIEVESALNRDIPVIPVLVNGARMPKASELPPSVQALSRRNAVELTHARFGADAASLTNALKTSLKSSALHTSQAPALAASSRVVGPPLANRGPIAWDLAVATVCVSGLALAASFGDTYIAHYVNLIAVYAIAGLSLNFLLRCGGAPSLGHAIFSGAAAYATGYAASRAGLNLAAAVVFGTLVGAIFACLVGSVVAALRGIFAVAVTLFLAELVSLASWRVFGADGVVVGPDWSAPARAVVILSCLTASYGALLWLERVGYLSTLPLLATLNLESEANRTPYSKRLVVFSISGAFCSLAGALYLAHNQFIEPHSAFYWTVSATWLAVALAGGQWLLSGAIVGAVIFLGVHYAISFFLGGVWGDFVAPTIIALAAAYHFFGQKSSISAPRP